jgi:hypothetical protein
MYICDIGKNTTITRSMYWIILYKMYAKYVEKNIMKMIMNYKNVIQGVQAPCMNLFIILKIKNGRKHIYLKKSDVN